MKLLLVVLALALATGVLRPAGIARADEGDIEVVSVDVESQFPDGVKFSITARSSEDIDEIRIFFKKEGQSGVSSYRSVDFQPGKFVTGDAVLSSKGGGDYFPPGTSIKYSFEIRDKGGGLFRSPEKHFIYDDNRFEWLTVSSGLITVYYYGEYVEERAKTVLEAANLNMERMVPVLGIEPTEPLRIVSYNNYRHMSTALPFRAQAVRELLRTQGMAFTDERVLLVHGFDATVRGTVSHEFTHLLVAEAAGRAISQVPAWLNEGLAEYGNIDPTDDYDGALRYGIFTRRLKPLWYLDSFGGTPDDIIIAYGQGRSVVGLLIGRYGPEKMAELFRVLRNTLNIDLAMEQVYGFDQYGLDTEWRTAIGIDPLPPPGELESQLEAQAAPTPAQPPGPVATPSPEITPTAEPQPTPSPGPTPAASIGDKDAQPASPGGCSSPAHSGGGPVPLSLGSLLLLGGPLGLLSFRALRRRRDGTVQSNTSAPLPLEIG